MSIKCKLVDRQAQVEQGEKPQPGDMWFLPKLVEADDDGFFSKHILSNEYKRDWLGKRPPICVCLPCGLWFNVDSQATDSGGQGWTVTGEAPNITVSPSINAVDEWHGWLRNGELTEA
jgi:hypothetical protein